MTPAEPTIACLIATWRDELLLAGAIASAAPHVDAVVVLDGAYRDVAAGADVRELCPWRSRVNELAGAIAEGALVYESPGPWRGEIEKRNVLLELARAAVDEPAGPWRWALVLDADELLHNGAGLRSLLAGYDGGAFACGLLRREPDGATYHAPSRLFRLTDGVRYAGRSDRLRDPAWGDVDLSHSRARDVSDVYDGDVWIEHRWDRRSPWRRDVQAYWGRRLAELDAGG